MVVSESRRIIVCPDPLICNLLAGLLVPIPIFPPLSIVILAVLLVPSINGYAPVVAILAASPVGPPVINALA